MKPWDNGALSISENQKYFVNGKVPFFWLGDTAWLLFSNISEAEAYTYLKNRADKGYNVIQVVLIYTLPDQADMNKMAQDCCDVNTKEYWEHCDRVIAMAEELGMYMALLPSWGSLVKQKIINIDNVQRYAEFLGNRYGKRKNIIWLLGGDIKPIGYEAIYEKMGNCLKAIAPQQLIGFHPFGRCSSTLWFKDSSWLDFNMFQSGHRRYDQCTLGSWDDNEKSTDFYGEDNWKYVNHDLELCNKPTLDGEPSYELILQGLHDDTQPYWTAMDVRRYAYWSVFEGACGHTYGDNSIMQFYKPNTTASYGAKDYWYVALHHEGSGEMQHLKDLMTSVDFTKGRPRNELLTQGQKEKYNRISVFASKDFLFAYNYSGRPFEIDLTEYINAQMWWFSPVTGAYSYIGNANGIEKLTPPPSYSQNADIVLIIKYE